MYVCMCIDIRKNLVVVDVDHIRPLISADL